AFARLADALIRALHRAIEEHFAHLHGRIAGQQTMILALGKLGGHEMTASSDLDLIVVYDFDPERPESARPPRLYGAQSSSPVTQRHISALRAQTYPVVLYKLDVRLRPPGRCGPVAPQLRGFAAYQEHGACPWAPLALTRARRVGVAAIRGAGRGGHP